MVIYPAPEGEALNAKFKVTVNGIDVPVYNARICTEDKQGRDSAGIPAISDLYFDITGFASFDMKKGPVKVVVSVEEQIYTAKILPASFRIIPTIKDKTVSFEATKPQHITVEVNGDHIRSLHLFVNPEVNNSGYPLHKEIEFLGYDADHAINNVLIENVVINGRKVALEDVVMNDFVYNVTVK